MLPQKSGVSVGEMSVKIKKGDTVEVVRGNYRGERGTVHIASPEKNKVVVSGINMVKKHQRPTGDARAQTGIIEREAPIDVAKVALVCTHCDRATRVGYQIMGDGSKVRVCKHCNEFID